LLLYRWRGEARNFGDELNTLLWPRLLPELMDDNPDALFLGIGSVLDARHDNAVTKVVAGAGYGGYAQQATLDASWVIHWVRGPRTARRLRLSPAYGLGDPAMLLPLAGLGRPDGVGPNDGRPNDGRFVGFMPHFESLAHGAWAEAATLAGVELIDPRGDPIAIIAAIANCRMLVSEAMHGVIVADALRVPWVALLPLAPIHRLKWQDWAEVLELRIEFQPGCASSLTEWLHASRLSARHRGRRILQLTEPWLRGVARRRFVAHAARALRDAAAAPPQLSSSTALDRSRSRMQERLEALRRNPLQAAPGR
jgi:succinoglycan biosynthesis protein ExoV